MTQALKWVVLRNLNVLSKDPELEFVLNCGWKKAIAEGRKRPHSAQRRTSPRRQAPTPKIDKFKAALNLPTTAAAAAATTAATLNQRSTRATQVTLFKMRHIQNSDAVRERCGAEN
jgi:hypothetical protein